MQFDLLSMMQDGMKMLKFLEQDVLENTKNKRNIKLKVKADLSTGLDTQIDQMVEAVQKYVHQDYWDSKNARIVNLMGYPSCRDLVLDILVIISPLEDEIKVQEVVGQIAPMLGYDNLFDGIRTAAELLGVMQGTLFTVIPPSKGRLGIMWVKNHIKLGEETKAYIANCQYLMPMITKPLRVVKNTQEGHVSFNGSILLGKTKHHNLEVCLDIINTQNAIPLCLDKGILEYEEESKKGDLDPNQLDQFNKLRDDSRKVYDTLLSHGNRFYLTGAWDGRGRLYCKGYHCTYQAGQYKRALVLIDKTEVISGD